LLTGQLIGGLPVFSAALALLVVRRHLPNGTRTQFSGCKPIKPTKICCHGNIPWGIDTSDRLSTAIVVPTLKIW